MNERTAGRSNRWMAVASLAIGMAVALATILATTRPGNAEAELTVALNDDEVGWPFYAAVQQQAVNILEDPAAAEAVARDVTTDGTVEALTVELPGDLALITVRTTASNGQTALDSAAIAGQYLVETSRDAQRDTNRQELARVTAVEEELAAEVEELADQLEAAEGESARVPLRNELDVRSRLLSDTRVEITDIEVAIENQPSQFEILGIAARSDGDGPSLLSALAAGAGATVLALLIFSFFSATRP